LCPSRCRRTTRLIPRRIIKFFREHQWPSFLEYSEHPYATCEEIKKGLRLKAAFSTALDQMQ
jgi:hypothetical protein